jgi:hypothetical protein
MAESRVTSVLTEVIGNAATGDGARVTSVLMEAIGPEFVAGIINFNTAALNVTGVTFNEGLFRPARLTVTGVTFDMRATIIFGSADLNISGEQFVVDNPYGLTSRFNLHF